jgi:hypothetical protein
MIAVLRDGGVAVRHRRAGQTRRQTDAHAAHTLDAETDADQLERDGDRLARREDAQLTSRRTHRQQRAHAILEQLHDGDGRIARAVPDLRAHLEHLLDLDHRRCVEQDALHAGHGLRGATDAGGFDATVLAAEGGPADLETS